MTSRLYRFCVPVAAGRDREEVAASLTKAGRQVHSYNSSHILQVDVVEATPTDLYLEILATATSSTASLTRWLRHRVLGMLSLARIDAQTVRLLSSMPFNIAGRTYTVNPDGTRSYGEGTVFLKDLKAAPPPMIDEAARAVLSNDPIEWAPGMPEDLFDEGKAHGASADWGLQGHPV